MTAARRDAGQSERQGQDALELGFPEAPAADVLEMLGTAQRVMADLAARDLRLSVSESDGEVRIAIVTLEGAVVRKLATQEALEILSGSRPPGLGIDAPG